MRTEFINYTSELGWRTPDSPAALGNAQLVLVFGEREALGEAACLPAVRARYPHASVVACSTGGNIAPDRVLGEGAVATAVELESSSVRTVAVPLSSAAASEDAGRELAAALAAPGLRHVLVFAEGLRVNGSALARGLAESLPQGVSVTGGLAADGDRFVSTAVGLNGTPSSGLAIGVGFYGERLDIGIGSFGGWEPFGPDRVITRSEGNILHELDGRNALDLYKELLGTRGYALPASGLLFPLKVRADINGRGVVRTILGVDEAQGSVTFAGDVPQGWSARLLHTSLDGLIAAAGIAAERCADGEQGDGGGLAIAVSCIGRRLLLQQRASEEVARVQGVFGHDTMVTGFYAYGELAPASPGEPCELHNQTMTITRLRER